MVESIHSPVFGNGSSDLSVEVPTFKHQSINHFDLKNKSMAIIIAAMSTGTIALESVLDRPVSKEAKNKITFTPSYAILKDKINHGASVLLEENNLSVVFSDGKGCIPQPTQWKKANVWDGSRTQNIPKQMTPIVLGLL